MLLENRAKHGGDIFIAALTDILMIEPFAFLVVEFRTALAAMGQVKKCGQFIHRHQFAIISGIPSEQCQKIDDSLGQIAALTISR